MNNVLFQNNHVASRIVTQRQWFLSKKNMQHTMLVSNGILISGNNSYICIIEKYLAHVNYSGFIIKAFYKYGLVSHHRVSSIVDDRATDALALDIASCHKESDPGTMFLREMRNQIHDGNQLAFFIKPDIQLYRTCS